ncbi:MAG TPA: hypothetical protein VMG12_44830 [Polyangiaceae bacterium]|nr:hypothetical protein [Polyangiaceae bacterium]
MRSTRNRLASAGLALLAGLVFCGCERDATNAQREVETRVEALTPSTPHPTAAPTSEVAAPGVEQAQAQRPPSSSACPEVERQARELRAALPRQLDADTRATRVTADGCDLRLEYELSTLSAHDVSERGLRAMRTEVIERLCADKGALAVMQRGGRFTNVYTDRAQAPIGLFTVAADDCGI